MGVRRGEHQRHALAGEVAGDRALRGDLPVPPALRARRLPRLVGGAVGLPVHHRGRGRARHRQRGGADRDERTHHAAGGGDAGARPVRGGLGAFHRRPGHAEGPGLHAPGHGDDDGGRGHLHQVRGAGDAAFVHHRAGRRGTRAEGDRPSARAHAPGDRGGAGPRRHPGLHRHPGRPLRRTRAVGRRVQRAGRRARCGRRLRAQRDHQHLPAQTRHRGDHHPRQRTGPGPGRTTLHELPGGARRAAVSTAGRRGGPARIGMRIIVYTSDTLTAEPVSRPVPPPRLGVPHGRRPQGPPFPQGDRLHARGVPLARGAGG
ncbi:protein of unknown function [Streptantibioticus cattleyicolor NRRL 8057 = DSM 46488]|nr:protein of unknown function [Streptantibioticus cattleyicolor NRRL 8057 = DSM 46488]